MRYLNRLVTAAAVVVGSASAAAAQQGTVTTGGGGSLGSLSGTGGLAGGLGGGGLGGGTGGGTGGGGSLGGSDLGGTQLQTMQPAPQLAPPSGQNTSSLDSTNFLSGYYANPYYQGLITSQVNQAPGGFGQVLMGTGGTGARGTNRTNLAATGGLATATRAGATGGLGGRAGGALGGAAAANNYGVMVPMPVQLTYAAVADFSAPPVAAPQLQSDLSAMVQRSLGTLSNPAGVQVLTTPDNNVVLRGTVRDAREARLVEGMVRLTPGVAYIKNELTFPAPVPAPGQRP